MNNTSVEEPQPLYSVLFGCVVALGLPLNAVSLWTLLRHHSLKSPSVVFMVNLALSDLLLVFSLPLKVYFYATGTWPLGNLLCNLTTMLFRNNIRSSAVFITFISVDRLLAVVYPLRSRLLRTSTYAWRAAALVWLLVVLINVPESLLFATFLKDLTVPSCFEFEHPFVTFMRYVQPALVFTMLAVNIVCTALVSWTLKRRLNDSARVNNKLNVMLIFVLNLIMFMVFFLPGTLAFLIQSWRPAVKPLVCLASVNCCLDPFVYYFCLDAFWKKKEDVDLSRERQLEDILVRGSPRVGCQDVNM